MHEYGIICDVGGKIKGNQDSAFYANLEIVLAPGNPSSKAISQQIIISLIADGVSGSHHGEQGSDFSIRTLSSKIMNYFLTENVQLSQIKLKLQKLIKETNQELLQNFKMMIQKGKIPKSTLVGMVIIGQWIWIFNLGDSRAYLIKDNHIKQISVDHVGKSTEHEITQAMGQEDIDPYIKVYNWAYEADLNEQNLVFNSSYYGILCSDGLTDKVSSDEIKRYLIEDKNDHNLQTKVENLYNLSIDRKVDDNISIIAIDLAKYIQNISPIRILKLMPRDDDKDEQ